MVIQVMPLLRSLTRTQRVGLAEMLQQAPRVAATMVQKVNKTIPHDLIYLNLFKLNLKHTIYYKYYIIKLLLCVNNLILI
jgi:hypothetical protein